MTQCIVAQPLPVLKVVSEEWVGYTNADGTGTYWDIIRAVYGKHYQIELIATTWSRALNLVETARADILVGSYKDTSRKLIYPKYHLDLEYPLYALFDKTIHNINEMNDLAGLYIAGNKDYGLEKLLPSSSHFYGVPYIDNVVNLIDKKRIDVAISYRSNLSLADPENRYSHKAIGKEQRLYLAFSQSAKGEQLRKRYEQDIIILIANDELKQYFPNKLEYQHAQLDSLLALPPLK